MPKDIKQKKANKLSSFLNNKLDYILINNNTIFASIRCNNGTISKCTIFIIKKWK